MREDGVAGVGESGVEECSAGGAFGGEDDGDCGEGVVVRCVEGVEFQGCGEAVAECAFAAEGRHVVAWGVGGVG